MKFRHAHSVIPVTFCLLLGILWLVQGTSSLRKPHDNPQAGRGTEAGQIQHHGRDGAGHADRITASGINQATGPVLEEAAVIATGNGGKQRVRIHPGPSKYPLLRTVEELEADGTVSRISTMAADHLLVPVSRNDLVRLQRFISGSPGVSIRKTLAGGDLVLLCFPEPESPRAMDAWLERLHAAGFNDAGPDYIHSHSANPNDPGFTNLWGQHNIGQTVNGTTGTADADIDAPESWDVTTGSPEVIVAVIDSGVDYSHPDLSANMWTDANGKHGYDYYADDSDPQDENGHGTHVAGTIAAVGNNGIGVTGVAWHAKIMALRFMGPNGQGLTSDAISCIRYATDHGARILNNSWGSSSGTVGDALNQEITRARDHGVLFIAAAGNLGQGEADATRNNDLHPSYPANYPDDNIISVAATGRADALASFSHYGATTVQLAAPGEDIYSTAPSNSYRYMSGTSMAAPHVAGAAALVLAAGPGLTYSQIRTRLLTQADAKSGLAGKVSSGGRLNAHRAIQDLAGPVLGLSAKNATEVTGNSDAYPNPLEVIGINLTLANTGSLAASGCTIQAALSAGAPAVLNRTSMAAGDLSSGASATFSNAFQLDLSRPAALPATFTVTFTLSVAGGTTSWSDSLEITIYNPSVLTGSVTRASTHEPLADAAITIQGPVSARIQTDANGKYRLPAVSGTYQVTAAFPGLLASEVLTVAATGEVAVADFQLGDAHITFQPDSLHLVIPPGQTRSISVTAAQLGDTPRALPFQTRIAGSGLAERRLYGLNLNGPQPVVLELDPQSGLQTASHPIMSINSNEILGMACTGETIWLHHWPSFSSHRLVPVNTTSWTTGTAVPLAFTIVTGIGSAANHVLISAVDLSTGNPELHAYGAGSNSFVRVGPLPAEAIGPVTWSESRQSYFVATPDSVREAAPPALSLIREWPVSNGEYLISLAFLESPGSLYSVSQSGSAFIARKRAPDTGSIAADFSAPAGISHLACGSATGPGWISTSLKTSDVPATGARAIPLSISTVGMSLGASCTARLSLDSTLLAAPVDLEVLLTVGEPPAVSSWDGWFENRYQRLPNAADVAIDADRDGMPAFLEFATGGDPADSRPHPGRPVLTISGNPSTAIFSHLLRKSLAAGHVIPEYSVDLRQWQTLADTPVTSSYNADFDRVTWTFPATDSVGFLRLNGNP